MNLKIRQEKVSDYEQVTKVHDLAFEQVNEGQLVSQIRFLPDFIPELSLVAEHKGQIIGHILFSKAEIRKDGQVAEILCLAPLAVLPSFQNQNVGTALVKEGLSLAKALGFSSVTVLGHPNYYPRFGFKPASLWKIFAPFEVADEVFMVLELEEGALKGVSGIVHYAAPFNDL